jgi:Ala-tRNA(Pro) deacylase
VVFDDSFAARSLIAVHPLRNTATVALPFEALQAWLRDRGHAPRILALGRDS